MASIIPLDEVLRVRQAVEDAHAEAAAHFRSGFDQSALRLPPRPS